MLLWHLLSPSYRVVFPGLGMVVFLSLLSLDILKDIYLCRHSQCFPWVKTRIGLLPGNSKWWGSCLSTSIWLLFSVETESQGKIFQVLGAAHIGYRDIVDIEVQFSYHLLVDFHFSMAQEPLPSSCLSSGIWLVIISPLYVCFWFPVSVGDTNPFWPTFLNWTSQ